MKSTIAIIQIAVFTSLITIFNCENNSIPYDFDDPELNLDTLTISAINGGTYLSPPTMGTADALYFGNSYGNKNLFSLIKFASQIQNSNVKNYTLVDTSVTVDSLNFLFTATQDTLLTNSEFELYYFPSGGDSVFSESESNYLNISDNDVSGATLLGRARFTQKMPDSTEKIYPTLSFKIDEFDDLIDFFADTTNTQNRTFMLKNIDSIDEIVGINSSEAAARYPIMNVHFRTDSDTIHSIFRAIDDVTIVEPRSVTEIDKNNISISRAAGLKSILKFDFKGLPIDSTLMVIKSAELIINSIPENMLDDYVINAAILADSLNISNYWEIDKDEYSIEQNILMKGTISENQLKMEIRSFLQGINTKSYSNFGLKLFSSTSENPFKTVNFLNDSSIITGNPILKIVYVEL